MTGLRRFAMTCIALESTGKFALNTVYIVEGNEVNKACWRKGFLA